MARYPALIKAVMHQESGGNRFKNGKPITSSAGAGGMMQIMPGTAAALGLTDVHDPEQAIFGGARYLRQMLDHFNGDTTLAVAAYNAGPGNIEKYLKSGTVPEETAKFVPAVASHYRMFAGQEATRGTQMADASGRVPVPVAPPAPDPRYSSPTAPESLSGQPSVAPSSRFSFPPSYVPPSAGGPPSLAPPSPAEENDEAFLARTAPKATPVSGQSGAPPLSGKAAPGEESDEAFLARTAPVAAKATPAPASKYTTGNAMGDGLAPAEAAPPPVVAAPVPAPPREYKPEPPLRPSDAYQDRKSTRLNSSHG